MIDRVETANSFIQEGNFGKARKIYSDLLDNEPENSTFIAGFFISSFWDNRFDLILRIKEGKERGRKLVALYEEFDKEIKERKYPITPPYEAATSCILGEASFHFRLAFQKEGNIGLDPAVLIELAICLMRTGDYKNADDILAYAYTFNKTPQIVFYRAECFYFIKSEESSKIAFMEGFLMDPSALKLEIIRSEPLYSAIETIRKTVESEGDIKEYLPVYLLEKKLLPVIARNIEEVKILIKEVYRLYENLKKAPSYQFKLNCRILQFSLHILENIALTDDLREKIEAIINEIDPEFLGKRYG